MVKDRSMDVDMTPSIIGSESKKKNESLSRSSSTSNYEQEKDLCFTYFSGWSQEEQVEFAEQMLGRMTHYQHGQINAFLKPMLQRDFISALPGRVMSIEMVEVSSELVYLNFKIKFNTLILFQIDQEKCNFYKHLLSLACQITELA